jgi:hypothetical protein
LSSCFDRSVWSVAAWTAALENVALRQQLAVLRLAKDAPTPRRVQDITEGDVTAFPEVGVLHHRYERRAA